MPVNRNEMTLKGTPCKRCARGDNCPDYPHRGPPQPLADDEEEDFDDDNNDIIADILERFVRYQIGGGPYPPPMVQQPCPPPPRPTPPPPRPTPPPPAPKPQPELVLGTKRGEGGFGVVFSATFRGQPVAAKIIKGCDLDDPRVKKEVDLCSKLSHTNVVKYLGVASTSDGKACLLSELMNSSLAEALRSGARMSRTSCQLLCLGAARGLAYLHSQLVVHLDVKADNVLLDAHGTAKICDFGISKYMTAHGNVTTVTRLSTHYAAPEVLDNPKNASTAADVYAMGILILEVFHSKVFHEAYPDLSTRKVLGGWRPPISADVPEPMRRLIQDCWEDEQATRPSMDAVVTRLRDANVSQAC